MVGLGSASAILLFNEDHRRPLFRGVFESRPMRFFGKYSYAMYLLHLPIQMLLMLIIPSSGILRLAGAGVTQGAYYVVATSATAGAAMLTWRYIEKPMLDLRERLPW
jgi:peptidoglycan/LPS O-acetylase OafA/YrhL